MNKLANLVKAAITRMKDPTVSFEERYKKMTEVSENLGEELREKGNNMIINNSNKIQSVLGIQRNIGIIQFSD